MRTRVPWIALALAFGLAALAVWVLRPGGDAPRARARADAAALPAGEPAAAAQALEPAARLDAGLAERVVAEGARPAGGANPREELVLLLDILDPSGAALCGQELQWALEGVKAKDGSDLYLKRAREGVQATDGAGRLRVVLAEKTLAWTQRLLFVRYGTALGGRVTLRDGLAAGEVDLGPLRLATIPSVAAGRVVDGAGRPVAKAEVRVEIPGPRAEDARLLQPCVTEADGRFDLRAWFDPVPAVQVTATVTGARPCVQEVPFGSAGLTLVLRRNGSIAGRVLHGGSGPPKNLRLLAAPRADGGEACEARPGRDGTFLLRDVAPGLYDVTAVADGEHAPLAHAEVLVLDGERARPPELDPLDLRGVLREVVVRIKAFDRRALEATLCFRATGASEEEPWSEVEVLGVAYLATTAQALDLRASAPGYCPVARGDVAHAATLSLEPGHGVWLRLREPEVLPASCALKVRVVPALQLELETDPVPGWRIGSGWEGAPRFKDGACRVTVSGAGTYTAVLQLRCHAPPEVALTEGGFMEAMEQSNRPRGPDLELERAFEVLDVAGEQTVWLDVEREAVERALADR